MNVVLPEKPKILNRRNVTYLTILIICAVAIAIAVYQFFSEEKLGVILGITKVENEEINELRQSFNDLFKNELKTNQKSLKRDVKKIDEAEDIVYIKYAQEKSDSNNYNINVKIPNINIQSSLIDKYNKEIQSTFVQPAEYILQTENRNINYTVNYMAYMENDILSLVILSTFKEGNNAQRTIVKTYNYNLKSGKEVTLNDFMKIKYLEDKILEDEIKNVITNAQEKAEQFNQLGYDIFSRDTSNQMYKLENTKNFFMYEGYLYIVYAYGNDNNTSEMDIVII